MQFNNKLTSRAEVKLASRMATPSPLSYVAQARYAASLCIYLVIYNHHRERERACARAREELFLRPQPQNDLDKVQTTCIILPRMNCTCVESQRTTHIFDTTGASAKVLSSLILFVMRSYGSSGKQRTFGTLWERMVCYCCYCIISGASLEIDLFIGNCMWWIWVSE